MKHIHILFILTGFILLPFIAHHVKGECVSLEGQCSKTVFSQCCDPFSCELESAFYGKCKVCLGGGSFCWRSSECCSVETVTGKDS
uniref:UPF0506 domain-containing protein n=1 Tax=Trichobilharzia regenti TaxID=157069 RepID=A0AA85J086_TRIRE|nr:unnamed protein product [Trichobilharzia regenti]